MKIFDCFTIFNEKEFLEIRLEYLKDLVDYFIIIEGSKTFSGKEKKQFFSFDLIEDQELKNKIRYYYIDFNEDAYINEPVWISDDKAKDCWQREEFQRDSIIKGLFDANPDDLIIITDIDEIPNKEKIKSLKEKNEVLNEYKIISLETDMFYASLLNKTRLWYHPKILKYKNINNRLSIIRMSYPDAIIPNGGWHFSYFGGKERIENKINSFSHIELTEENSKKIFINQFKKENYVRLDFDLNSLPDIFLNEKYKNFFFPID